MLVLRKVVLFIQAFSTLALNMATFDNQHTLNQLQLLIGRMRKLTPVHQRAVAAVVGSAVADAASRPMHWLYDREKLENIVGSDDPAFWPVSISPFYSLLTGRRSCYNDLGYCMLRSLSIPSDDDKATAFVEVAFKESLLEKFRAPSEYAEAFARRKEAYSPAKLVFPTSNSAVEVS